MIDRLAVKSATVVVVGGIVLLYVFLYLIHWTTDIAALVVAVCAVLAVGRLPIIKRSRFGPVWRDVERGCRRLFVQPVTRRRGFPWRPLLAMVTAASLFVALTPWQARVPTVLLVAWLAGRTWRRRKADTSGWWSHRVLVDALVAAGVLKAPREGERLNLSYRGAPRHNEAGTTVTVALPQARTLADVVARRGPLAAALHIPTAQLEVTQHDDDPANVVRIHVATGTTRDVPAQVTTAERTTWTDPVRIGRDSRGEAVELALSEANTLVAGIPGSGKTTGAVRVVLSHYLLDPTTSIYLLDGKGSKADYGAARPMCARFVSGVDEDAVPDTLTMLTQVLDVVRARNASGAVDHPGMLVLLEELQDVRAAAGKAQREDLDATLGRVVRMGRAVSVHVLISTQRPSVDDVPSGVRNLVSQRLALMLRNGQDAALVLGSVPSLPLPRRRGQALLATADGTRAVVLDRLTEAAWKALCARAAALRASTVREPVLSVTEPSEAPTVHEVKLANALASSSDPMDPLLEAILNVLADADPAGITSSALLCALPGWCHELVPNPQALGTELRRHPAEVERVWRRNPSGASKRVWRARCRPGVDEVLSRPRAGVVDYT